MGKDLYDGIFIMTASKKKILIIEDDVSMVKIYEKFFKDLFVCRFATRGEEGLKLADEFTPDIILLDLLMPGLDGYEVCRRLRKDPGFDGTVIVIISSRAILEERLRGYEAGADDYLTKPFDPRELLAKINVYSKFKRIPA